MHTTQTTLTTDTDTDSAATDDDTPMSNDRQTDPSENTRNQILAPPDQRGGDGCCPWCLAEVETFEHREDNNHSRCGHCDAAIPVGADWYERDEKIIV